MDQGTLANKLRDYLGIVPTQQIVPIQQNQDGSLVRGEGRCPMHGHDVLKTKVQIKITNTSKNITQI